MRDHASTLREQKLFRCIFEHAGDAMVVMDGNGLVEHANRAARELPELTMDHLFRGARGGCDMLAEFRAELAVKGSACTELTVPSRGDEIRHIVAEGKVIDSQSVVVLRDVTEQKKSEEELTHLRRIESLGHMTASVVHDFNNLLTPILCLSGLLTRQLGDAGRGAEFARDISTAAERASALLRQVLAFVGRKPSKREPVSLAATITGIRGLIERVLGDGIQLSLSLDERLDHTSVDREQLEHVILNLAANARDAMKQGGRLTLRAANVTVGDDEARSLGCAPGTMVALTVTDTGVGMAPDVRARVFERFFTTKAAGKGTGLGLATARRFVDRSGGCIAVRSEPGRGTSVVLYLPRAKESVGPDPGGAASSPARGSETVLVVEDDAYVRHVTRVILEEHGYRVLDAPSVDVAIEQLERHGAKIDLVLADVVLPGPGARELLESLLEETRTSETAPKVLLMSGHMDQVIREQGIRESQVPLLRKAFSPAELTQRVRDVLDGKARLAEPSRP